jgi:selenocysteine lyase/cysteine desulfurase
VHLLDRLAEIPGVKVYGITDRDQLDHRTSIVSFTMEWATPTEAATHLGADGIQVWDGDFYAVNPVAALGLTERGGLLRVGLMSYNTAEEVDRLINSLKELAKVSGVQIG